MKFYETKEEKRQFICESFQLDANEILNADEKLKEAVIFRQFQSLSHTSLSIWGNQSVRNIENLLNSGGDHI